MKKIGIITINDYTNFGNRLQNYAVQNYFEKHNFDVVTIKCGRIKKYRKLRSFVGNCLKRISREPVNKRYLKFMKFNDYIRETSFIINKDNIPQNLSDLFDYFVVGSDQVWNPTIGRLTSIELLQFAKNNQKISISASFGVSSISKELQNKTKKEFQSFKAISVREDEGKNIISQITDRNDVEVLIDPTMLLSGKEWDNVSKKPTQLKKIKEQKYILNYFLGELQNEWRDEINRIAKENNCEIINVLDRQSEFYDIGPSEFLYLEKNAFLVCTDSFHSSVFSILYNTPFVVFNRKDKLAPMNSRIETLLSKFKLEGRKFNGKIDNDMLNCNYIEAKEILEEEKLKVEKFMKKTFEDWM